MSATQKPLTDRFMALSPGARVGIAAVAVLVVGLFIDDYLWSLADEWNAKANQLESLLRRGAARQTSLPNEVDRAAIAFGKTEVPSDEATTSQSLAKAITETLANHRVTGSGYESQNGGRLPTNAFPSVGGTGQRFERARGHVNFETDVDELIGILGDLEAHPSIDAINSLRINRLGDTRKVSVKVVAEAWALGAKDARKGGPQ